MIVIRIIIFICWVSLYIFTSVPNNVMHTNLLTNTATSNLIGTLIQKGYQSIIKDSYRDLLYRTYDGTYINLAKEASLIITSKIGRASCRERV